MNPMNQSHCPSGTVRAGTHQGIIARALLWLAPALLVWLAPALLGFWASHAFASPALVIEMPSGAILYEDHATEPWYPASVTNLMAVYVALSAARDHRITLELGNITESQRKPLVVTK